MSVPQASFATGTTYEAQFVDVSNIMLSARLYRVNPLTGTFSNVFANGPMCNLVAVGDAGLRPLGPGAHLSHEVAVRDW